jgi:peptidoglycan/xylan/chitin deacetylase (PgdA/CDA1 family)
MDTPAEASAVPAEHDPTASRRSFLRMAGAGLAGTVGAGAIAGTAFGAERYQAIESGRRRGDGATVATLSSATSLELLWRAKTDRKVVALTFDDGPGPEHTAQLLDVLKHAKVRASFAVIGRNAARLPDLVRREHAEGHEILNHTWDHADLSMHEYEDCKRKLARTDELIASLTGAPSRVIRPPYGRMSGNFLQYAAQTGQRLVLWDQRLLEDDFDAAGVADNIVGNLRPGTVVLCHDAGLAKRKVGMAAIPAIIAGARELGYEFVTVSEMFALDQTWGRSL